jgi:hypothetical protein
MLSCVVLVEADCIRRSIDSFPDRVRYGAVFIGVGSALPVCCFGS